MARGKKKENIDEVTFEQSLESLEIIVKQLERGELSLDDSLQNFSEGMSLAKICLHKLSSAQQQIDKILVEEQGAISEKLLDLQEDKSC